MKKITLIAVLAIAFVSCEKEEIKINSQDYLRVKSSNNDYTLITHKRNDYLVYHNSPTLTLINNVVTFDNSTSAMGKRSLELNSVSYEGSYDVLLNNGTDLILAESNDTLSFRK